ncbi:MAG TPA: TetR/AcrR family transcriptional regulator [Pseudonocardiaceae bacterium]|jgi:AcrR family transcriptional regulator|nr:TetR/AcrR family transcriptional regulator [Pseudonocardiaceae bacterium]
MSAENVTVKAAPPKERILATTRTLFYGHGIQATGVGELAEVAGVSKRTLYQLFESKDELVAAYLALMSQHGTTGERNLDRTELDARERLLALFERPRLSARFRGCPLHNAAVELADPDHPGRQVIVTHKHALLAKLTDVGQQAGARRPAVLARQLITLYEGATALATSLDDVEPFDFARSAAETLIDAAVSAAG